MAGIRVAPLSTLLVVVTALGAAAALTLLSSGGLSAHGSEHSGRRKARPAGTTTAPTTSSTTTSVPPTTVPPTTTTTAPSHPYGPFAVGIDTMTFTEPGKFITRGGVTQPRSLVTYIRYPASGSPAAVDVPGAAPAKASGPYPLVVFGPGYDLYPSAYSDLLQSWARAGYVVAAPVFPLTNPGAPGGPYEADIVNQPADVTFLIGQLLAQSANPQSPLYGLIQPSEIAVAGHSDGGDTAMAVAYDTCCRDTAVKAAMILSGAELNMGYGSYYPPGSPPLLAVQGTADTINAPTFTYQLYDQAPAPKYLVQLLGAGHLGPYTRPGPYLSVVETVTVDFLNRYLKHIPGYATKLRDNGEVPGVSAIQSVPPDG